MSKKLSEEIMRWVMSDELAEKGTWPLMYPRHLTAVLELEARLEVAEARLAEVREWAEKEHDADMPDYASSPAYKGWLDAQMVVLAILLGSEEGKVK